MADDDDLVAQLERVESDLTFRKRFRRRVLIIAIAVAVDLVVSVLSIAAFIGVRDQQDRADADRVERSRGSCIQYNAQQQATRAANINLLVEGFRPFTNDDARLDQFRKVLEPIAERGWPYRDCSDAGIERFLEHPPQDPNTGG